MPKQCHTCKLRFECTEICDEVEKQLPRLETNTIAHELSRGRKSPEILYRRMRQVQDLLEDRDILVGELRKVFDLVHNEGCTFLQIKQKRRYGSISAYNVYQKSLKIIELRRSGIGEDVLLEIMNDFNAKILRKKRRAKVAPKP